MLSNLRKSKINTEYFGILKVDMTNVSLRNRGTLHANNGSNQSCRLLLAVTKNASDLISSL